MINAISITLGLLCGCMLIYIGFVLVSTRFFLNAHLLSSTYTYPFVSVIIPARNESQHISKCLESVLTQSYPAEKYEVILVDDQSTDQTVSIAQTLTNSYPNLKIIRSSPPKDTVAFKKAAISSGIGHARGEIILQIDGDCWVGPNWLATMIHHFDQDVSMVCGPVALHENQGTFIEKLQSLESMGLVALGAGAIQGGWGNMCNGANMAYRKELFEKEGGFNHIDRIASGDDELLLQKFRQLKGWKILFAKSNQAIVRTHCISNWKTLKAQRIRWVSKARYYTDRRVNLIQLISYLGFLSFPFLAIFGFILPQFWLILIVLFVLKFSADLVLMIPAANFFERRDLLCFLPALQLVYIPYVIWIGIAGNRVRRYQWKERMVH